ncbi:hypothetical protein BDW22DRAFT_357764 [Trametopsis cervina]|nr:hypothetical protein BDW22DRAFT_357764 [Trametopsis cervina]
MECNQHHVVAHTYLRSMRHTYVNAIPGLPSGHTLLSTNPPFRLLRRRMSSIRRIFAQSGYRYRVQNFVKCTTHILMPSNANCRTGYVTYIVTHTGESVHVLRIRVQNTIYRKQRSPYSPKISPGLCNTTRAENVTGNKEKRHEHKSPAEASLTTAKTSVQCITTCFV